jgi:hypothetical protein
MFRKLALHLILFATIFNVAGGYTVASSFKTASFSICQLCAHSEPETKTVVKKASSDVVIVTMPLIKEADEDEGRNFAFDFYYAITSVPHFLPLLRAGPSARFVDLYSLVKGKQASLFLLNCNFRI